MNPPKLALKVLVLLLSVTLAGCFVAYRAGAFKGPKDGGDAHVGASSVENEPMMPSTKSMELPPRQDADAAENNVPDAELMGSSKSGKVFSVDSPRKELPPENNTFMGSSKNDGIFEPDTNSKTVDTTAATHPIFTKPGDPSFMGSSKSAPVFGPPTKTFQITLPNNATNNKPPK